MKRIQLVLFLSLALFNSLAFGQWRAVSNPSLKAINFMCSIDGVTFLGRANGDSWIRNADGEWRQSLNYYFKIASQNATKLGESFFFVNGYQIQRYDYEKDSIVFPANQGLSAGSVVLQMLSVRDTLFLISASGNVLEFYYSADGAATWKKSHAQTVGNHGVGILNLSNVLKNDTIYRFDGQTYSSDAGKSWKPVPLDFGNSYSRCIGDAEVLVYSKEKYYIRKNGEWIVAKGLPPVNTGTMKVHRSTDNVLYFQTNTEIYRSFDGGLNWTPLDLTGIGPPEQLEFSGDLVYLRSDRKVFYSDDQGDHWRAAEKGLDPFFWMFGMESIDDTLVVYGEGGEGMYYWKDTEWLPWTSVVTPATYLMERLFLFEGRAIGRFYNHAFLTADQGKTWKVVGRIPFGGIVSDENGVLYGHDQNNVYISTDGGYGWTEWMPLPESSITNGLSFEPMKIAVAKGFLFFAGQYVLYRTDLQEKNWREVLTVSPNFVQITHLEAKDTRVEVHTIIENYIYLSEDSGSRWREVPGGPFKEIEKDGLRIGVGGFGQFYTLHESGEYEYGSAGFSFSYPYSLVLWNNIVLATNVLTGINASNTFGQTWTNFNSGVSGALPCSQIYSYKDTLYANCGALNIRPVSDLKALKFATPVSLTNTTLFPNPSAFDAWVVSNEEIESVEVYHASGKRVFHALPADIQCRIPAGTWAEGVYNVRVRVDGKYEDKVWVKQ